MKKFVFVISLIFIPMTVFAVDLVQVVNEALKSSPYIQSQKASYKIKQEYVNISEGSFYPTLDLTAKYGYEHTDIDNRHSAQTKSDLDRSEISIRFTQPLFEGFDTYNNVKKSKMDAESQRYDLLSKTESYALDVCKAYINVLKTKKIAELSKENLKEYERIKDEIESKYKQGVANLADWSQIRGRTANAKANLYIANQDYRDALAIYKMYVGSDAVDLEEVEFNYSLPQTKDDMLNQTINNNPQLLSYKKMVESANYSIKSSKSNYLPSLYFDAEQSYNRNVAGVEGRNDDTQLMLRLEYNFFNGFKDSSRIKANRYQWNKATRDKAYLMMQIKKQVDVVWNNKNILLEQMPYLKEHVDLSLEVKDLYEQQYNVGKRSLLDMLSSDIEVFTSRKTLIERQYDLIIADYEIIATMGKLLNTLGVKQANK
jgi:adhesin transport system outer membrane protein